MNSLFNSEKVNTERQLELDIAKALSIIFMVFVHCIIICEYLNYSLSDAYTIIVQYILGGPCAAPVFMFCMGVGIIYSKKKLFPD